MGIQQRTINGRALYEAARLNGVDHIRGDWITFDEEGKPTAGCAIGLMGIHLGVAPDNTRSTNYGANIFGQLNRYEVPEGSKWFDDTEARTVGQAIVYWNDRIRYADNGDMFDYWLPTWEEVHEMIHDLLEPLFTTEFTVDEWVPDNMVLV